MGNKKRTAAQIAADITKNASAGWDEQVSFAEFSARGRWLWAEAERAGVANKVAALVLAQQVAA